MYDSEANPEPTPVISSCFGDPDVIENFQTRQRQCVGGAQRAVCVNGEIFKNINCARCNLEGDLNVTDLDTCAAYEELVSDCPEGVDATACKFFDVDPVCGDAFPFITSIVTFKNPVSSG